MKHNVYMNNDSLSITKLEMDEIVHLIKTGELNITRKEFDAYLKSHQQRIIDENEGITNKEGIYKMYFPKSNIEKFITTFSTSGMSEDIENYQLEITNFKDDLEKKKLVPSCTIDTIFQNRRRLKDPHQRAEYFTMDLDLKNIPLVMMENNYGTNGDCYQQLANTIYDRVEAENIQSLLLMFISGSEKGVKMIFNSQMNNLKKEFVVCSDLIDKAIGFSITDLDKKQQNKIYDLVASTVITTPINIHKSTKVYYNKYATPLIELKTEKFKEIKNLPKTYDGIEKTIMAGYDPLHYKSGLHNQLYSLAVSAKKRGFPNEFISDTILGKWGNTPDHNSGKTMKDDIEKNILKYALNGVMSNTISYEIIKDEITQEDILVEKMYSYDTKTLKWVIDEITFETFLIDKMFRLDTTDELYRKDKNIIIKSSSLDSDKKSMFFENLELLLREILENDKGLSMRDRKEIIRKCKDLVVFNYLSTITTPRKKTKDFINPDTKNEIYLYTKNSKIKITRENIEATEYEKEECILETQLIKNNEGGFVEYNKHAKWEDYKSLPFYKKIAGDNKEEDFNYLCSIIGFLISTERSANSNYNVLFVDGVDDKEGGGTGKSVIMKNLEYIRHTLKIGTPSHNEYIWGGMDNHNIIYLEDVIWSQFSIKHLRNFYDLGLDVRKMRTVTQHLSGSQTPRLCITTNYAPDSMENPDSDRLIVFKPFDFFDRKDNQADKWLGIVNKSEPVRILEYTKESDWSYWLSFMTHCCQVYLKDGISDDIKSRNKQYLTKKRDKEMNNTTEYFILQNKADEIIDRFSGVAGKTHILMEELTNLFKAKQSKYNRVSQTHRQIFMNLLLDAGLEVEYKAKVFNNRSGFEIIKK